MPRASTKRVTAAAPVLLSPAPAPQTETDLDSLGRKELQQLAKALGIKANGKNADLIDAIKQARGSGGGAATKEPASSSSSKKKGPVKKVSETPSAAPTTTPKPASGGRRAAAASTSAPSRKKSTVKKATAKSVGGRGRAAKHDADEDEEEQEQQPPTPVASPAAPSAAAKGEEDLEAMSRAALQSLAKAHGLKANGKTKDLIANIRAHQAATAPATDSDDKKKDEDKDAKPAAQPEEEESAQPSDSHVQDSPPPIASLSDQRLQDGEEEEEEQQPKGVQEEAAARRRMSLARQMKEKRNQQLNQVKNKLSKAIHAISKSKTRNSPRLHRVEQQQQPRQKPAMPAREKENLRLKLESERMEHAVKSLQGNSDESRVHRSPVKSDAVRKAQAGRREGYMAVFKNKRQSAFDKARQAALESITENSN